MVTRRTRLTSAIVAIMMLVSMLTAFALPAVAETPVVSTMTEYHAGTANAEADGYTVATLAELELLSLHRTEITKTVYITANITVPVGYTAGSASGTTGDANKMNGLTAALDGDLDGDGTCATISGLRVDDDSESSATEDSSWLGHFTGSAVKNLKFYDCISNVNATNYGALLMQDADCANMVLDNLTFDNCKTISVKEESTDHNCRGSLVIGRTRKAGVSLTNITIVNCELQENGTGNTGFLLGATNGQIPGTIQNIYMNNNTISGSCANSVGVVFGEIEKDATVSNVIVLNTTQNATNRTPRAVLVGSLKSSDGKANGVPAILTLSNIITANNGVKGNLTSNSDKSVLVAANDKTKAGSVTVAGPIYSETVVLMDYLESTTNTNVTREDNSAAVATGEAAWAINKVKKATDPFFTMVADAKLTKAPAFGTAANQTVKVALDFYGTEYAGYVNLNDTIDLDTLSDVEEPVYEIVSADQSCASIGEGNVLSLTAPSDDNTITITLTSNKLFLDDLKAKIAGYDPAEVGYYTYAGTSYNGTLADLLAEINVKIVDSESDPKGANAYANNDAVNEDMALLDDFVIGDIIPITGYTKYPAKDGYTVSNAKELEILSTLVSSLTAAQKIYFTADIDVTGWTADTYTDVDGDVNNLRGLASSLYGQKADNTKAKITGLAINGETYNTSASYTAWLGYYKGDEIKGLSFENCHVTNAGAYGALLISRIDRDTVIEDVVFNNCSVTAKNYATGGQGLGFMVGYINATNGADLTFENITITDCTMNRDGQNLTFHCNSGFLLAKNYQGDSVTATNIYLEGNTVAGIENGGGRGVLFGELMDTAVLENIAVLNTTANDGITAILVGTLKGYKNDDPTKIVYANLTAKNVIVGGTSSAYPMIIYKELSPTMTIANVYTDATDLCVSTDVELSPESVVSGRIVEYSNIQSGEAAAVLNDAGVAQQWSMDGATPIFATETAKATIAVTFKVLDAKLKDADAPVATYTLYTDKDGKLLGLTQELLDSASWNDEADLATMTFDSTNNTVIGYVTPAHDHQYVYTDNGDGTHDVTCAFSHTDAELGTFTCDYKAEDVAHKIVKKTISDMAMTPPSQVHQVVDACEYCDYKADDATATDCTGTVSRDDERSTDATCAHGGMIISVCDACDYEFTRIDIPRPHDWSEWTHIVGTNTHKRSCSNVANCQEPDQIEDCTFTNWTETIPPQVTAEGEETGTCTCGNTATRPIPALTGIVVEPTDAIVGQTFDVAVKLENNTKVAGLELEISYNADLFTLVGAKKGDWDVVFDDNFPTVSGAANITFNVLSNGNAEGDGTFVILTFQVKNDENLTGTKSKIAINVTEAFDADTNPVGFEGGEAEVEILTSLIKGDINGDRFVNMADAILLLRYYTEKPDGDTECTINGLTITDKIADISDVGDGDDLGNGQFAPEVNINDVLYLLRYLNGWYTDAEFFGA